MDYFLQHIPRSPGWRGWRRRRRRRQRNPWRGQAPRPPPPRMCRDAVAPRRRLTRRCAAAEINNKLLIARRCSQARARYSQATRVAANNARGRCSSAATRRPNSGARNNIRADTENSSFVKKTPRRVRFRHCRRPSRVAPHPQSNVADVAEPAGRGAAPALSGSYRGLPSLARLRLSAAVARSRTRDPGRTEPGLTRPARYSGSGYRRAFSFP